MANPQVPPQAPGKPIPPPSINLPWGSVGHGGAQVWLNQHSYEFLQLLWSALQGQGSAISGAYAPMSNGADPPSIVDNGAGEFVMVPYTP